MKKLLILSLIFMAASGFPATSVSAEPISSGEAVCIQTIDSEGPSGGCAEPLLDTSYISPPKTGSVLSIVIIIAGLVGLVSSSFLGLRRHLKSKRFSERV